MADCISVTAKPIRVQLPGGEPFAPALSEAASKTAARSGLSRRRSKAFENMVDASVALLNSGNASTITLEIHVHEDSLSAKLVGSGCKSPQKKLVAAIDKLGESKTHAFERCSSKTAVTISFDI